ncbi:FAD-dependent monooxygenase [Nocardia sp. NPDC049526]|uniref:FAD-dependent monooxygenase n=1 Tax=Nocardia sp. NPDC049526 TaxID=3364316 RepID=UPI0037941708
MDETGVLIAGAGPIGLTTAIELRRRGVSCRIIDPLLEPPQYAKAVGIQPRTLEVFEGMGVLRQVLDAAIRLRGQILYINGAEVARMDLSLPPEVPFTDGVLVCIPLPGRSRYRISMLVPDELASAPAADGDNIAHGFESGRIPELSHLQAVLDRLGPEPAKASELRWSSVFRISHRIVDSYSRGRAFVAGDAAHIHPPTGAQGMNTGIQDAHNLAWKLALAVEGDAATDLLASYDAERRPVGEEVVGRTVRSAREGIGADSTDPDYVMQREAQLLIEYGDSPIVDESFDEATPRPGSRAPDVAGLTRDAVSFDVRLFSLFGRIEHTILIYADETATAPDLREFEQLAAAANVTAHGHLDAYLIAAPKADVAETILPLIRDTGGKFAHSYRARHRSVFVVRPDGYLGFARRPASSAEVTDYLKSTFR